MDQGAYIMAGMFILAGLMHFIKPGIYRTIMPPFLPKPGFLVYLSGAFEIAFGVGMIFEATRTISAVGIILMLIAFLPVHTYMLQTDKFERFPRWALLLRIPLQFGLMYWVYLYI